MSLALVTGSTGLLGNNIVRELLSRGHTVRTLVRKTSDSRPLAGLNVEPIVGDITDEASVKEAAAGVDVVYHSAAHIHIGWTKRDVSERINVDGTRHIADAVVENEARLVHISTVDTLAPGTKQQPADEETAGEKPPCTYVASKRGAEQVVKERVGQGLNAVVVHPGFMLGPWDWKPSSGRMLLEIVRRFTPAAPRGGMSVCDARDVACGAIAAAEHGVSGRHYILAGENMTYLDAWKMFVEVAGQGQSPRFRAGPVVLAMGGLFGDLWARLSGNEGDVNSAAVKMANCFNYYSSARAAKELGYESRPAEESTRDAWQWFIDNGY